VPVAGSVSGVVGCRAFAIVGVRGGSSVFDGVLVGAVCWVGVVAGVGVAVEDDDGVGFVEQVCEFVGCDGVGEVWVGAVEMVAVFVVQRPVEGCAEVFLCGGSDFGGHLVAVVGGGDSVDAWSGAVWWGDEFGHGGAGDHVWGVVEGECCRGLEGVATE